MFDVYIKEKIGERFTDYNFEKWRLGPFSWDIIHDVENLKENGSLANPDNYYQYTLLELPTNFEEIKDQINSFIKKHDLEKNIDALFEIGKDTNTILSLVENRKEVKKAGFGEKINF